MNGRVNRTDKLNGEFQKEIYEIIARRLKNPLITEMFTVSEADVSPDLKHAKIYLSVFSSDEQKKEQTFKAIVDSAKEIRKILGEELRTRTVPELRFIKDGAYEYGDKIDNIIAKFTYSESSDDDK